MSKLRIVITDTGFPDTEVEERELAPLHAELIVGRCKTEGDVLAITRDADALMVQWAPITRRVMGELARCRFISRYGVGIDMIDLDAARERGIPVANVPDYCVEEVAAHTLCFLMGLGRKVFLQDRLMRRGQWSMVDTLQPVHRFGNQNLGIIGVGRIGKRFAEMAAPLGLRILGYDVRPDADIAPAHPATFDTVIRESDYLSLHCPLTKETRHLINAAVLGKMKPGSFLINVSRGGVVDTQALVQALQSGRLAGAALDVFEQEPLPQDHLLLRLDNVILTPHLASYSLDAAAQLRRDTARNVTRFFQKA